MKIRRQEVRFSKKTWRNRFKITQSAQALQSILMRHSKPMPHGAALSQPGVETKHDLRRRLTKNIVFFKNSLIRRLAQTDLDGLQLQNNEVLGSIADKPRNEWSSVP